MSKGPWHPCDDCLDGLAEAYARSAEACPPPLLASLELEKAHRRLHVRVCERWLEFHISGDVARSFRDKIHRPLVRLGKWERRLSESGYGSWSEVEARVAKYPEAEKLMWELREEYDEILEDMAESADYLRQLSTMVRGKTKRQKAPAGSGRSSEGESRPPRLWSHRYCPNCGLDGIEFISYSEFDRRCKELGKRGPRHDTVGRRVRDGKYWGDATGGIPWCKRCKDKTPEGRGVAQPVEAPHVDDYGLTSQDQENILTWAEASVRKVCRGFDRASLASVDSEEDRATELYHVAITAISDALKSRGGELTRDQAEDIADRAIQEDRNKEYKSRVVDSRGKMDDHDPPAEDDDQEDWQACQPELWTVAPL